MSASSHSFPKLPPSPDVLGELLHSLSQPLTSLRCSLELSIGEVAEQQQEGVAIALQQTEKVIGMIQLMREYLDAEQPVPEAFSSALAPVTRRVIEELSSIAVVRGVELRLVGTCSATMPVPESRLQLALQYLIATVIEAQPVGGKVMLLLGEGPAGAVLRGEGEPGFRDPSFRGPSFLDPAVLDPSGPTTTLRRVKLAIASRVFENAGASLVFGNVGLAGFVLRIPRRFGAPT
jgi:hypothetical protein